MAILESIFAQYSLEAIIIFIVSIMVAAKFLSELWDWLYGKIKGYFKKENERNNEHEEVLESIKTLSNSVDDKFQNIEKKIDEVNLKTCEMDMRLGQAEVDLNHTQERLQENTRNYLIDAHHKYVYKIKAIDDLMLQSLERRYMYYKTSGGNSFIDNLMDEIRSLPKIQSYNPNILHAVHQDTGLDFIES